MKAGDRIVSKGPAIGFGPHDCVVVEQDDTRDTLIAKGLTPEAADEVLAYGEFLKARGAGFVGDFKAWLDLGETWESR